jgi:hypothetical protein
MRYDKLAANYLAFVQLASIRLWLSVIESTPWFIKLTPARFVSARAAAEAAACPHGNRGS